MADDARMSRKEAKAVTRARLLTAALEVLDEDGEAALTTTEVTRRAGIAQSSFYVHFVDMDDLVHGLVDHLASERRRQTRAARRMARRAPGDVEALRDTFRLPLADLVSHPRLFGLVVRSRYDRSSPLGEWSRGVLGATRAALVEVLVSWGMPDGTDADRRRAEMVADGLVALTEMLALGHLEGRYPDLEEVIDVLVAFSRGYFPLLHPDGARLSSPGR